MKSHQRCIRTITAKASWLAFNSDGKQLIASDNQTVDIYDVNTGELKKSFTQVNKIDISYDRKTLAVNNINDSIIQLWDLETGEFTNALTGSSSANRTIMFSPDNKTLVSADQESIKLWSINTDQPKVTPYYAQLTVDKWPSIEFSPNGQILAIRCGKSITFCKVETGQIIRVFTLDNLKYVKPDNTWIDKITFSPDGDKLVIRLSERYKERFGYIDGSFDEEDATKYHTEMFDWVSGQISYTNTFFDNISPDRKIGVGYQKVIDIATNQKIYSISGTDPTFSRDSKILALLEGYQALRLLECSSGATIAAIPGPIRKFTLSLDANIVAVTDNETIKLWQASTEPIEPRLYGDAYPHLENLENLLAVKLWDDADQETATLIQNCSSSDLNLIDQLWVHYSNGYYGFSLQKIIWERILQSSSRYQVNCQPVGEHIDFGISVGWDEIYSIPHYHGANDESVRTIWHKGTKAYYPREAYGESTLGAVLSRFHLEI